MQGIEVFRKVPVVQKAFAGVNVDHDVVRADVTVKDLCLIASIPMCCTS